MKNGQFDLMNVKIQFKSFPTINFIRMNDNHNDWEKIELLPSSPPSQQEEKLSDEHILRQYDEEIYDEAVGSYYADIFTTIYIQFQCLLMLYIFYTRVLHS